MRVEALGNELMPGVWTTCDVEINESARLKQHRLQPTRSRQLRVAGWEDSAIMEALGWKSIAMLRRDLGKIPVSRLKTYPMALSRVLGPAA